MHRYPSLLLFALAACGDPATDSTGSSTGTPGSSGAGPDTSDAPTTGSGTGPGTATESSSGGAEGGQTTGPGPTTSGPGPTTDEPGTTTDDATTTDATTTGHPPPLEHFLLGMHVADVSPSPDIIAGNQVFMGAYGAPYTRGPAQGVHDPIFARSFAIEGNGGGLIMSVVDLPGMGNEITREVRKQVAAKTGLSATQVLIGTTHSHSAPDFMGLWGSVPDGYRDFVVTTVSDSMAAAWMQREPGTLKVGADKAPANNRRGWGFTDDDMTILDAFDLDDQRIGTVVVFAAHPVVLGEDNKLISCDYPGYFVQDLEATLGAPVALFNGTLGDATPKVPQGDYPDDFARAEAYGQLLAGIAVDITSKATAVEPELEFSHTEWVQTVDNLLFKGAALLGILMFDFEMMGLDQKVTTQSTYFRLGASLQGVAFPGEPLTRLGLALKEQMQAPHKLVLGNTGDALGYFIPSDEWQTGKNDNYEETVSMGKTAGDTARDEILPLIEAGNANL